MKNFGAVPGLLALGRWAGALSLSGMSVYGPKSHEMQVARQSATAEAQKAKAFLEKAAKEKGAKTSPFGLVYTEMKEGTGPSPAPADTVKVHFKGALMDGTVFDDSNMRGKPPYIPPGAALVYEVSLLEIAGEK